jgi:hypothetical protein
VFPFSYCSYWVYKTIRVGQDWEGSNVKVYAKRLDEYMMTVLFQVVFWTGVFLLAVGFYCMAKAHQRHALRFGGLYSNLFKKPVDSDLRLLKVSAKSLILGIVLLIIAFLLGSRLDW